jgi:hypothetical protein
MTQQNVFTRDLAEAARVEAAMADGRAQYVALFERMFLALGADVIKIAEGTRHDAELAEARGLAAHRWNQLLSMEAQVEREEQQLVARPKQRPPQPPTTCCPTELSSNETRSGKPKRRTGASGSQTCESKPSANAKSSRPTSSSRGGENRWRKAPQWTCRRVSRSRTSSGRRRRPFRLAGRIRSHRSRRWGTATTPRLPPGRVSIRPLHSPRRKAGPPSSNRAGWSAGVGPGERYFRLTAP